MRIRKHAKVSPLLYASSSTPLSHGGGACQLNQSPWDVITFSPSSSHHFYQVDVDDSFLGNGSFGDSGGAVESVASLKLSCDDDSRKRDIVGGGDELCSKNDEKGWQCRRRVKKGKALCDYHLDQPVSKKSDKGGVSSEPPRRRPRQKKATSLLNPNYYYYYSGFGPRWGKRRGGGGGRESGGNESGNIDVKVEPLPSSPSSEMEEFDYSDDYEEDEEVEKKRSRKPIKARSLKSLM